MKVTISTHNGSAAHREHNIRKKCVASKQPHIDMNGVHEIWRDETARAAYHRIFDDAVKRYNARQKRADRKIANYYSQIEKDEKKHPVYEMIIGIYGKDEYGNPICSPETGYEIMKEFFQGWDVRNPNLELIGAYYHADEEGEPHVHLDYIPVAHGYKNGMDTQSGLVKALGEMGFFKAGKETAQIQWEARENKMLENLCKSKNLVVDHPEKDGSKHLYTDLYKTKQELEKASENLHTTLTETRQVERQLTELKEKEQLARDAAETAEKEKQKAIWDADDAKIKGNVFEEAQKALERTRAECFSPAVRILKETEGKTGLFGSTEATVTIRKVDYDRLQQNYEDVRRAEKMYQNVLDVKDEMKHAATVRFTNLYDSKEVAMSARVLEKEKEINELRAELADTKERFEDAQREIQKQDLIIANLKKELSEYNSIVRFFPNKWKRMMFETTRLREMEALYERGEFHYHFYSGERYLYVNCREVSEKEFLQDYLRECHKYDLNPKKEMNDRLTELTKPKDPYTAFRL